MNYHTLMMLHLWSVLPAFILGTIIFFMKKGTRVHKTLGQVYMVLMLFTAIITLFMSADVGPTLFNHLGWLHLFSFLTLWTVPSAYIAIKKGNVKAHKRKMIILYIGAILLAGGFTLLPGRYLHHFIFT